ncbi:MAG: hypothetical protein HRT71_03885, partial [Flavobacteriales bacterium]|nr:hypothetical protein [Flavobacteriales bacterium]
MDLIDPPLLVSTILSHTEIQCFGGSDGTITGQATGGTSLSGNYTYSWTPAGGNTDVATGLPIGTYTLMVTDDKMCTATADQLLVEPIELTISATATNLTCFGSGDGEMASLPVGDNSPYTYAWAGPGAFTSTDQNITGLDAGGYTVTVTDANNCTAEATDTPTEPAAIVVTTSGSSPSTCAMLIPDGAACVSGTTGGDSGPYTYLWDDASASTAVCTGGVGAGPFTVIVTDGLGCTGTAIQIINDLFAPVASVTLAGPYEPYEPCFGDCELTADLVIDPNGSTAPYTVEWSAGNGFSQGPTGVPGLTDQVTTLCVGMVSVSVYDFNNCLDVATIEILEPTLLVVPFSDTTAVTCSGDGDGEIEYGISGGTPPYNVDWNDNSYDLPSLSTDPYDVTLTNFEGGTYNVIVTDAQGCIETMEAVITEPTALSATFTETVPPTCLLDGTATATFSGGSAPYDVVFTNTSTGDVVESYTDVVGSQITGTVLTSEGNYTVVITDNKGCSISKTVTMGATPAPVVTIATVMPQCADGDDGEVNVTFTAINGGPYNLDWTWSNPVEDATPESDAGNVSGVLAASADNILPLGFEDGSISVSVTDVLGCTGVNTEPIGEPDVLTISASVLDDYYVVDCFENTDAELVSSPSGGTQPYEITWTDATAQEVTDITQVGAGTYTVNVLDENDCPATDVT